MAYEVRLEIKYEFRDETDQWKKAVYRDSLSLSSKVPTDDVGDVSYHDYRQIAAMEVLSRQGGDYVMVPTDEDKMEYRLIPKSDVIWIKATTVKTLDKE